MKPTAVQKEVKRSPKYTVMAGRHVYRDGVPYIYIGRCEGTEPTEADVLVHKVCKMLNMEEM